MDLTHEEIERHIEQISNAEKVVYLDGKVLLFKYPNRRIKTNAQHIYDSEYEMAIEEGLLSAEDMQKLLKERNLITEEERKKLESLKSKLEGQKVLLARTTKVKANQDRIKGIIHEIEQEIREIEYKERSKLSMTAETRAEELKILYLCWASTYNFETNELYWDIQKHFMNEPDYMFRQKAISEFILFYGGISTKHIRQISRSNLWRIRYITSVKTSEPLFGVPTTEYTNDMLNLVYWSHYYQNIYEMMPEDQPDDSVIEDDEALDAYMKSYYDEKSKEYANRKDRKKRGGKLSAFDKDEVILTRSNELYEDVEFDTPREAQAIKDKPLVNKRSRVNRKSRIGRMPDKIHK